jgi:hypothetical protein
VPKVAKKITGKLSAASIRTRKGMETEKLRRKGFLQMCADAGLPEPLTEHRFHDTRAWRLDFVFPSNPECSDGGVALESDGNGRHTRWAGFREDAIKRNEAQIAGYVVLHVPSSELCTDSTIALVKRALEARQ